MMVGTFVECTCKNRKHTGQVVAQIGTSGYGVAWDAHNRNFRKPGNTDPQYPAEFVKAHRNDIAFTSPNRIRPAK